MELVKTWPQLLLTSWSSLPKYDRIRQRFRENILKNLKQFLVLGITGVLAVTLVKISILDFFLSLFSSNDGFRVAAYALMGVTATYGLSFTIVVLAGCRPFGANWDQVSHPHYQCIDTSKFYVAQGAIGAVLDCLVLLLPLPIVWSMRLNLRKKIILSFLLSIGILYVAVNGRYCFKLLSIPCSDRG